MSAAPPPRVSIVTVNRNNAAGLAKTLDSVRVQTFRDFEHIVIDGGSTDGSVDEIRARADGLADWVSEPDAGIYNAMNKGLRRARGEYVQFLNSGDWLYDPQVLERAFSPPPGGEDLLYGDYWVHESPGKSWLIRTPEILALSQFHGKSILCHQATFYRRALFGELGPYNERNQLVSDWEFNVRALLANKTTRHLPYPLVGYQRGGRSLAEADLSRAEQAAISAQLIPAAVQGDYERLRFLEKECRRLKRNEALLEELRNANLLYNYARMAKWGWDSWRRRLADPPPAAASQPAAEPRQGAGADAIPGGKRSPAETGSWPGPAPRLSIVTVNRNHAAGLANTIASVRAQTFPDFEFIVIDGASTDGSRDVIAANADRIARWVSEPDGGIYAAMNKGTAFAKGAWLLYLNSGDLLASPDVLAEVAARMPDDVDWFYGDFCRPGRAPQAQPDELTLGRFFGNGLCHQTVFFRKTLLERFGGYDETYRIEGAWELMVRALLAGHRPRHVAVTVAIYEGGGISDRQLDLREGEKELFRRRLIPPALLADYRRLVQLEAEYRRLRDLECWLAAVHDRHLLVNCAMATKWQGQRLVSRFRRSGRK